MAEIQVSNNSDNVLSNNTTNDVLSKKSVDEEENKKKCNHQLIHLIGKLIAKIPLYQTKEGEEDEDTSTHKSGTCNSVSMLTISNGKQKTKIITKGRIKDENLKKWQKKKIDGIVYNTHLQMIKGHQPKDYSLTTQENVGETFWEYKKAHDLTSVRRIYIFTKLAGMLKVDDLLSPLIRWCKNHSHEDIASKEHTDEMIKVFAEHIEEFALEKEEEKNANGETIKTNKYTKRALLFQKALCCFYYDHLLLNLQDRKSNNICLSCPIYDKNNNVLDVNDELFIDIDTEKINGYKFMFDYSFEPDEEKERIRIVELWMSYVKKILDKVDKKLREGYYTRRLSVEPMKLTEKVVENFIMCGFYDKDKITSSIFNHLNSAINYWKKVLKDKKCNEPKCRKLIKLSIKNFNRCINKYWTKLTKDEVFYGEKFEEAIRKNKEAQEKPLQEAMNILAHCDAFGVDINIEK